MKKQRVRLVAPRPRVKCSSRLRTLVHWGLLLVLALSLTILAVIRYRDAQLERVRRTLDSYLDHHAQFTDEWWLPTGKTIAERTLQRDVLLEHEQELERIIARYAGVTPLGRKIRDTFPDLSTTALTYSGASIRIFGNGQEAIDTALGAPSGLELCFVPGDMADDQPSVLWYSQEWQALMVCGLKWPELVYPAFVVHELGHAYAHHEGWPSATEASRSVAWSAEEVLMHELEGETLNVTTRGAYFATLDEILGRTRATGVQATTALTLDDLLELDRILGMETASFRIANLVAMEHTLMLALRSAERRRSLTQEERGQLYLDLTTAFTGRV